MRALYAVSGSLVPALRPARFELLRTGWALSGVGVVWWQWGRAQGGRQRGSGKGTAVLRKVEEGDSGDVCEVQ